MPISIAPGWRRSARPLASLDRRPRRQSVSPSPISAAAESMPARWMRPPPWRPSIRCWPARSAHERHLADKIRQSLASSSQRGHGRCHGRDPGPPLRAPLPLAPEPRPAPEPTAPRPAATGRRERPGGDRRAGDGRQPIPTPPPAAEPQPSPRCPAKVQAAIAVPDTAHDQLHRIRQHVLDPRLPRPIRPIAASRSPPSPPRQLVREPAATPPTSPPQPAVNIFADASSDVRRGG